MVNCPIDVHIIKTGGWWKVIKVDLNRPVMELRSNIVDLLDGILYENVDLFIYLYGEIIYLEDENDTQLRLFKTVSKNGLGDGIIQIENDNLFLHLYIHQFIVRR